ncbi:MAG: MmcQ/YjbR family DNA-binding protein [Parvularculaceae bacterium]|nr:MmcQ/YjbR family DNA-binding protein [Parvularculaceae bacterium]
MSKKLLALQEKLRRRALALPEAREEAPWGHIAVKVRGKTFVFLGGEKAGPAIFSMTVKLPVSAEMAKTLPFVTAAGYGLGKSGWVTVRLGAKDRCDFATLAGWIEQSYRAVAPKTLAEKLGETAVAERVTPRPRR